LIINYYLHFIPVANSGAPQTAGSANVENLQSASSGYSSATVALSATLAVVITALILGVILLLARNFNEKKADLTGPTQSNSRFNPLGSISSFNSINSKFSQPVAEFE